MEINITNFFTRACPSDYFASVAEKGPDAGPMTWAAAVGDAPYYNLLDTEEKRQAVREYVAEFGAWGDEEIAGWSDVELNALFIQLTSGDIREAIADDGEGNWSWDEYQKGAEAGQHSGNLFLGDDNQVYYYVGI